MYTANQFPQRTTSPVAHRLHALLRYCPGYGEVCNDRSRRVGWVLTSLTQLARPDLPIGCIHAVRELQAADLTPTLTRHLSIDQLCKIVVEVGRYCAYRTVEEEEFTREQERKRRR